jgi:hypothetical protein
MVSIATIRRTNMTMHTITRITTMSTVSIATIPHTRMTTRMVTATITTMTTM